MHKALVLILLRKRSCGKIIVPAGLELNELVVGHPELIHIPWTGAKRLPNLLEPRKPTHPSKPRSHSRVVVVVLPGPWIVRAIVDQSDLAVTSASIC